MSDKPLLAITMGDPSGVGSEVTVKTLLDKGIYAKCNPFVVGNTAAINSAINMINASDNIKAHLITSVDQISGEYGIIDVLDIDNLEFGDIEYGTLSPIAGKASVEWILKAGELAAAGDIQAIATAPINKEACSMAGYKDIGHMEIFQSQTNSLNVATMLMARNLRVVHLTTHKSLRNACDYVTKDNVLNKILLTDEYFKKWGWKSPRIGVAALNPHASDGGLLGDEEEKQILPAVNEEKSRGIEVKGPIQADTVFNQNIDNKFDVCIAMYHDQGHIPIKVYDWARSVSVNLGLPFVRTSVDHGTAFDIAGKGLADHISMKESIEVAVSVVSDNKLP